ncbi:MAG TPA: class I SAM-dependent methyltransferase, partial [Roseiflexaceae bacterium]|nr:class I SAM-dependent methyltransferase [Roseiflexaceae bacterium]
RLAPLFAPGERVLELGCGTGEDALWLARRGVHVTATDASPGMLAAARAKAEAAGVAGMVDFARLDIADCSEPGSQASIFKLQSSSFDGALSNFGALNCLPDRRPLAGLLAQLVRPNGRVALVVMGPLCPWEIGWHLARGRMRDALRRLQPGAPAHVGGGATLRVWYPSPRRLRAELAPHFRHLETVGVGALLPPSYLHRAVERHPALFATLALLERRMGGRFPWTWLNDHYLSIFERR